MMDVKRLPFLDYGRVFAAYLVIFGHLLLDKDTTIRPYIYSFHIPLFFLVSGMLHKNRGGIAWKKYLKTLIVPFLFFNLFFFILWPLCWKIGIWGPNDKFDGNNGVLTIYLDYFKYILFAILYGEDLPNGPTWFLLALLWCKIITDCICKHMWVLYFSLCALTILIIFPFHNKTCVFIGNALMVLPFFYGGFRYKKAILQWCTKRWAFLFGIGFLLADIPLTIFNGKVSTYSIRFGQIFTPFNAICFYINAFSCSLGLLFICMIFPTKKYITLSAKALISILCVSQLFVYTYRHLGDQTNYLLITIVSALIFIVCVLVHQLLERYLPFSVGK